MDKRGSRTREVQRMIMHTDGEEQDLGRDEKVKQSITK